MGSHLLSLVFLSVCIAFTNGRVELFITPSMNGSCPQDPCLTLSQFAADSSNYTGNETNINHRWVTLANIGDSMQSNVTSHNIRYHDGRKVRQLRRSSYEISKGLSRL